MDERQFEEFITRLDEQHADGQRLALALQALNTYIKSMNELLTRLSRSMDQLSSTIATQR